MRAGLKKMSNIFAKITHVATTVNIVAVKAIVVVAVLGGLGNG